MNYRHGLHWFAPDGRNTASTTGNQRDIFRAMITDNNAKRYYGTLNAIFRRSPFMRYFLLVLMMICCNL